MAQPRLSSRARRLGRPCRYSHRFGSSADTSNTAIAVSARYVMARVQKLWCRLTVHPAFQSAQRPTNPEVTCHLRHHRQYEPPLHESRVVLTPLLRQANERFARPHGLSRVPRWKAEADGTH